MTSSIPAGFAARAGIPENIAGYYGPTDDETREGRHLRGFSVAIVARDLRAEIAEVRYSDRSRAIGERDMRTWVALPLYVDGFDVADDPTGAQTPRAVRRAGLRADGIRRARILDGAECPRGVPGASAVNRAYHRAAVLSESAASVAGVR